jgi:hypothetical protein
MIRTVISWVLVVAFALVIAPVVWPFYIVGLPGVWLLFNGENTIEMLAGVVLVFVGIVAVGVNMGAFSI